MKKMPSTQEEQKKKLRASYKMPQKLFVAKSRQCRVVNANNKKKTESDGIKWKENGYLRLEKERVREQSAKDIRRNE